MAEVFRASDSERGGAVVALKKILPQVAEDEEFIQMFEDEARIASQLEHPHIARTLDFGRVPGGDYYIAFEYVHGKDMRTVFERALKTQVRPPLNFLLYVFARIGEGLSYAHARKDAAGNPVSIVHRDVSPQNIVVSYQGDVKLIDFGIAKAAGKLSRTQVGAIKGKFGYMSPEQVRGLEIDQRTDVFSLGICMWELLTSERLFSAANELLVLEKIRNLVIPAPSSRNPDVPAELDRIVLKALAKDLDERYRYAKELYRDLNVFAQNAKLVATREEVAEYMRQAFPDGAKGAASSGLSYKETGSTGDPKTKWPQDEASALRQVQETRTMADNKGSDLDIFEGLGKKSAPPPARGSAVPPPPGPRGGPPTDGGGKKTLLGIASPAAGGIAPPPRQPPPPSRASLPAVVPPPQRASAPPPPPAHTKPAPYNQSVPPAPAASGGMDMDWDDEDEATHIFDKDSDAPLPGAPNTAPLMRGPGPAAGAPPNAGFGRTMAMPNPPPPTSPGGFGPPPPPPRNSNAPPPPPPNALMLPVGNAPMQTQTEPLRMPPPRPPSAPPPYNQGQQQPMMHMQMGQQQQGYQQQQQPMQPPQQMAPRQMEATALVRPQPSSKAPLIIVAVLLILALGAAAGFFFLMPRSGKIAVNVADAKGSPVSGDVKVFVDGKKVCDTAPCIVDAVAAGSHEVKIVADKFDPTSKLVTVEARKDSQVDFALAGGKATGLKVAGPQPGVKLLVDGSEVGALPQELHDLTPGDHKLKFVGTAKTAPSKANPTGEDRYAPLEQNVTLAANETKDLGNITLQVVKGKVTITLGTPGARVSMVSSTGDRRDLPSFPISIEIEPAKATWSVEATKFGFIEFKQPVNFDDGQAEKVLNITLEPKGSAPATNYVAPSINTGATAVHNPVVVPTGNGGASTFALITALPPGGSVCLLDNKPLGGVPKTDVATTAGSHKIRCLNKEEGLDKTIDVTVGAGEAKKVVVKLRD